jgi:anti-sigma regulatory factor (Ser/Thr protein kinase)
VTVSTVPVLPTAGFQHWAHFYRDDEEFLAGVGAFVRAGLAADDVVVVVEPADRLELLREELADDAAAVEFHDMAEVGGNPARIVAVWQDVVASSVSAGRTLRGVGEPAFVGRRPAELVECHLHELLLNRAFDDGPAWRLLCPYDEQALPSAVSAGARVTHPAWASPAGHVQGPAVPAAAVEAAFGAALPGPTGSAQRRRRYGAGDVAAVRTLVSESARAWGLSADRVDGLVLAASELATNSVRHAEGAGAVAAWRDFGAGVVEFTDIGHLADPLAGRWAPGADLDGGRGLYLVNQLCDLVQLRSSSAGTTVRLTTWL